MRPFEIDTALADAMSSDGSFRALQRIITKSHKERTALEDQILLSVNWSGAAICETANHVEFLHHCVALECLLLRPHEDEQLTKTFSERLAYLIGRTREACQRVEKKAKRFYGLRSNIVHKALTDVSDDDVNVMAYYALQAIISMANRTDRWRSIEDFIEWANGVKYDAVTAATLPADA